MSGGAFQRPTGIAGWAYRLLTRVLPGGVVGASVLGDLQEEYELRAPGPHRTIWYVGVAIGLAVECLFSRGHARGRRPGRSGGGRIETVWYDVRLAARSLRRHAMLPLLGALTLALGIGANTAIFSVIYASWLRPLPFPEADRLMRIARQGKDAPSLFWMSNISYPNYVDLEANTDAFEDLVEFRGWSATLSGGARAQRLYGQQVGAGFFRLHRMSPALGREFAPEDQVPGAGRVVIVSHRLWQTAFDGDPDLLGRTVTLDAVPHTIVGIAHRDFEQLLDPQFWIPLPLDPALVSARHRNQIDLLGRLAPGVTHRAGLVELRNIFARLEAEYPEANDGHTVTAVPLKDWLTGTRGPHLLRLFAGAVAVVLLIACVNVANLLLARFEVRQRELAVRAALGAGRARLAQHFLAESLLIAIVGGAIGIVVSLLSIDLLMSLYGSLFRRAQEVSVHGVVLGSALALSLFTGLVVGLLPVWQLQTDRLHESLQQGGRGGIGNRQRARQLLVVLEVALAVLLVTGAGLMINSVRRLGQTELGIEARGVLTFDLDVPRARYATADAVADFYERVEGEVAGIPGIASVGVTSRRPLRGGNNAGVFVDGEPEPAETLTEIRNATAGSFDAIGVPLLAGRHLTAADRRPGANTAVVNEAFVRRQIPDGDGVNRFLVANNERYRIVGVVGDVRDYGPERQAPAAVYWPLGGGPWGNRTWMTVVVRATVDPMTVLPAVRERIRALDSDVPLMDVATMHDLIRQSQGEARHSAMSLLTVLAAVALALGAIGIYGVMAFTVAQRTREVGVRMALGASSGSVVRLVLRQAMGLTAAGVGLGIVGSVAGGRVLSGLLYDVRAHDPATLAAVTLLMVATAVFACYVPARRAASVPAVVALRQE